jgi:hypothetical protein
MTSTKQAALNGPRKKAFGWSKKSKKKEVKSMEEEFDIKNHCLGCPYYFVLLCPGVTKNECYTFEPIEK